MQKKAEFDGKKRVERQVSPGTTNSHTTQRYTSKEADLSILKKDIHQPIIKTNIMPRKDVSDIEKHVNEILSSGRGKSGSDKYFGDLSILKKR